MKRQIRYRYCFDGVRVSLVEDDGEWINIIEVAFLTDRKGLSKWESGAILLTADEINEVYNNATNKVKRLLELEYKKEHLYRCTEAMVKKHIEKHYSKFKCDLPEYHATNLEEGFFYHKEPKKTPLLKRQRK